jgi:outer membrane scaffolding protein for murein synthesis (MipA/OmpV family)
MPTLGAISSIHLPRRLPLSLAFLLVKSMSCKSWLSGLAAAAAWPALAAGNLVLIDPPPAATAVAVGPSLWSLPRYPGARGSELRLLPGVDVYTSSGFFASTDSGVGWNFAPGDDVQTGLRLWPQLGRRAPDAPPGLQPIGDRLQLQAYANWQAMRALLLQAGVLHGAGRQRDGSQLELGATTGLPLAGDLLGIGLSATCADRAYRQSYFGVSAQESAASGLPAFGLAGGWQDAALTFSGEHRLGAHWRLDGQWVLARLLGAAAQSPVAQRRRSSTATLTLWREL